MLERAFRSIIDLPKGDGRSTIDQEELLENFRSLQRSRVRIEQESYKQLYHRILDHFKSYVELPSYTLLQEHFENEPGGESVLVNLQKIKTEKPFIGGNYKAILHEMKAEQDLEAMQEAMQVTQEIAIKGKKIGQQHMKGVDQAMDYFAIKSREIRDRNRDFKVEAQIMDGKEINEAKENYEKRAQNQTSSLGIYSGLEQMDNVLQGLKHTEFMIVGAYTGQGKTTFSVNVLYRALFCGWDSAMFSLEMTLEEMQNMLYVLHTSNTEVFGNSRFAHLVGTIKFEDVMEGRLDVERKEFFFAAMDDLEGNPDYGKVHVVQPDKSTTTVEDIMVKCLEINSELKTQGRMLEFLVVDYIRLINASEKGKTRDPRENLNNIIKGLKRLCLTFNNGQGLRLLSPHQLSREGYVRALGNGGHYLLSDLSDTSEIEKSADVVITLFMDDALRKANMFKVCCLKARRKTLFEPFEACANLATKYMYSKSELTAEDLDMVNEIDLELEL